MKIENNATSFRSTIQKVKDAFTISLTDSLNPTDVEEIKQGLDSYDASQGATVDWVPLALFARDAEGVIIAGLTGSTYWGYFTSVVCGRRIAFATGGWAAVCLHRRSRKRKNAAVILSI